MIVDQAPHALSALALVIRESGLPIDVVGQARSGDEMVATALLTAPHIVILEIRLPKRSGLDALAELRRLQPAAVAIVVSSSDRFEDAVRCVELGVRAYLLKPLEPARVCAALADVVNELRSQETAAPDTPTFSRFVLPRDVHDGTRLCVFRLPPVRDPALRLQIDAGLERLERAGLRTFALERNYVAILLPHESEEEHLGLIMAVRRSLPGTPQLGVGSPVRGASVGASLDSAIEALDAAYFVDGEATIRFEQLPSSNVAYAFRDEQGLARAIAIGDLTAASRHFALLLESLVEPARSAMASRSRFRDLVAVISRAFAAQGPGVGPSLAWADHWSPEVTRAETAYEAARVLSMAWESAQRELSHQPSRAVAHAQQFIRAHAAEPLTVAGIATVVGLHPDHLSHLFRKDLGTTIRSYLADCRLHEATRLLASSTAPIASVSAEVGFADPRYFSRFFKQATGLTPREYRQRMGN